MSQAHAEHPLTDADSEPAAAVGSVLELVPRPPTDALDPTARRWQDQLVAPTLPNPRPAPDPVVLGPPAEVSRPAKRIWQRRYLVIAVVLDLIGASVAGGLAVLLRFGAAPPPGYLGWAVLTGPAWVLMLALAGAYRPRIIGVGLHEARRVLSAGIVLLAMVALASYATRAQFSRGVILLAIPAVVLLGLMSRAALRGWLHRQRARGRYLHRTLLVGSIRGVTETLARLRRDPSHGVLVVGACVPGATETDAHDLGIPLVASHDDLVTGIRATRADAVMVLSSSLVTGSQLRQLSWRLERDRTDLLVCSGLTETFGNRVTVRPTAHSPVLHVARPTLSGPARLAKAAFDRAGATLGLIVISPVFLGLMVAIWAHDRHSPFFRQTRVGRNGREFRMWKFRSMVPDAEARKADLEHLNEADGALFKIAEDPRITPIGRRLRRYSLDELPQLFNVVAGHMSLVGPRPPLPEETQSYGSGHRRRLLVQPGMTGLWQVSGRSDLDWEQTELLDLRYVENWSFGLDLAILARTVRAVVGSRGAY